MIPATLILFRFGGYGPEPSHGLAVRTADGRVVLAEAASNPGTSMTNSIESAVDAALQQLGMPEGTDVLQLTLGDPIAPGSVWRVKLGDEPEWERVVADDDAELKGAVDALRRASATDEESVGAERP